LKNCSFTTRYGANARHLEEVLKAHQNTLTALGVLGTFSALVVSLAVATLLMRGIGRELSTSFARRTVRRLGKNNLLRMLAPDNDPNNFFEGSRSLVI
jgi:hypothetical protein